MTILRWGLEQGVNTTTNGDQLAPRVAALQEGGWVVLWQHNDSTGGDGDGASIKAQRYAADGSKSGQEMVINVSATGAQLRPEIAVTPSGSILILWQDSNAIEYRRFQPDFDAEDATDRTDINTAFSEFVPDVAAISSNYVVVFQDNGGGTQNIRAQRLGGGNGNVSGAVIDVAISADTEIAPSVAASQDQFLVAWENSTDNSIEIRGFNFASAETIALTTISGTGNIKDDARVAALEGGRFVVSWTDVGANRVDARIIGADGSPVGDIFTVFDGVSNVDVDDAVALADGTFVILYESNGNLHSRRFDTNGAMIGSTIINLAGGGDAQDVTATVLEDGRIVAAWVDDSAAFDDLDDAGIRMQVFDPRGGVVQGTSGPDTLFGHDALDDEIVGGGNSDILNGLGGRDRLFGGEGSDTYVITDDDIIIEYADSGNDLVQSSISYTLPAFVERLTLTGTALNATGNDLANTLTGNAQNNRLDGLAGADIMHGLTGNDTYVVDNAGDTVDEIGGSGTDTVVAGLNYNLGGTTVFGLIENLILTGAAVSGTGNALANRITGNALGNALSGGLGNDTMFGGSGNDQMFGQGNNDFLSGGSGADRLVGDVGNDTLDGGDGKDTLDGGSGTDMLIGGTERDTMTGGFGNDVFRFTSRTHSLPSRPDIILDFDDRNNDRIDISTLVGPKLKYIHDDAFSGSRQVRIRDVAGADVIVEVNTGGSLGADFAVRLKGTTLASMTASDFIL